MAADRKFVVSEPTALLAFLLAQMPTKGRNKVKSLLTHRLVSVDERVVTRHDHPLSPGQRVTVHAVSGEVKESMHGVKILYEDEDLLVIDKPPRLLSVATDEERERTAHRVLINYVRRLDPSARVYVVHRLDKDTSGVMMFAKSEEVQQELQNNWKDAVQERTYVVVVEGQVTKEEGTISTWLKENKAMTMYNAKPGEGQKAVTHYRVLEAGKQYSLLEVRLETGRKNQIRVHMQSIGHSVAGDKRYGAKHNPLGRLGLHARVLSFRHPKTGEQLRFETAIPATFRKLVKA